MRNQFTPHYGGCVKMRPFEGGEMVRQARQVFARTLEHCRRVTWEEWRQSRTLWQKLKQRWAYFLLDRIDPYLARRQWRGLPK